MVLLICVALVNNILPITLKVSALANVSLNMITLCAVTCCILNRRLGLSKPLPALAIVALSGPKLQFLPPLSNTLFLIHPVLLYVSAVRSVITTGGFLSHGLCKSAPLLLLGLAMGLGGYWSLQELSWGGW